MSKSLRLAPDLTLPLEAITETIAILGIRGSGKTNTAAAYAEELLGAGQQVVILDPTDAWWGLKSSADGLKPGYPVVVLGGKHQDLPLASGDGKLVADFVVEQGASVVCSLRGFESKQQELAFATAFLRRLYYLKGQQDAPTPLALFIDEASRLVPQRVMGEDAACVGAVQQIVRQGRSSGFGVVLIDQRAATVNKDVLAQLEMLVVHRTTGPQDRKALREWVQQHDTGDREGAFLDSLASLAQGEAWFWSPGWLDLFRKVKVRARRTFDSSRTPKAGEVVVTPKRIADVDLDALRAKLAVTIEKAKADDPKELRKEIARLQKEVAAKPTAAADPRAIERAVESARATDARTISRLARTIERIASNLGSHTALVEQLNQESQAMVQASGAESAWLAGGSVEVPRATRPVAPVSRPPSPARPPSTPTEGVSPSEQKILDALALMEQIGSPGKKINLGFFSGYSEGGRFNNLLGGLRARGLVDYPSPSIVALTDAGRAAAQPDAHPVRTLDDLHALWLAKLPPSEGKLVTALLEVYPNPLTKSELGQATGYSEGGRFNNLLGTLRSLGAIDYPTPGQVVATDALFPEGLR